MRSVFSVTSLALSLLFVVAGSGCTEESSLPVTVEKAPAPGRSKSEPFAVVESADRLRANATSQNDLARVEERLRALEVTVAKFRTDEESVVELAVARPAPKAAAGGGLARLAAAREKALAEGGEEGLKNLNKAFTALVAATKKVPVPVAVTTAPGSARRDIVNIEKKLYSQFDEEIVIRDFFQDRRGGVFLDVGCAFPKHNSTTFYLDKHLEWTGIGVDAVFEYAQHWAKDRPDSQFFNFLISDHSDTEDTFYRAAWAEVSSARKKMVETPAGRDEPYDYTEIKVPTITINRLLDDNNVEKLDFMSMDIEGYQMIALAGFDIEKYQPELVGIEAYRPDQSKIHAWFEERGYKRIDRYLKHDQINWYYTPAGHSALLLD